MLYGTIIRIRNYLYDKRLFSSYQSDVFSINIGNLTVGGTGKTPHIEYLVRLLADTSQVAILSRGYGRKTRGFGQATASSIATEIGDEPLQIYQKFGGQIPVFVCEKRAIGLQKIQSEHPQTQVILLDDAFQHRAVSLHLNILLTDYGRLFYHDFLLPVGLLREPRIGAHRADAVVVSKCPPDITPPTRQAICQKIQHYTKANIPIFFSTFAYGRPRPYGAGPLPPPTSFWLLSGIAQPRLFESAAKQYFTVLGHSVFADHHEFKITDLQRTVAEANQATILTTEKDFVKIKPLLAGQSAIMQAFYYWPIEVVFLSEGFDDFILSQQSTH